MSDVTPDDRKAEAVATWNTRATASLAKEREALLERVAVLEEVLSGISDDFMTSEKHHPHYVLIPTSKFDQLCTALAKDDNYE